MNYRYCSMSIALLGILQFFLIVGIHAADSYSESRDELVVSFRSTTFEIDQKSFDDVYIKLDLGRSYLIQGYACSHDEKTEKNLVAEGERRAEMVRRLLIKKGFPSNNLAIVSYDYSYECKVILIAME